MQDAPLWESDWSIGLRVWAERNGQTLLGPGRLELLEAIDRCRSISGAARQVGVSYRHAWLLVQGVNEAAGKPLVESAVGGKRGGGARLTDVGRRAVAIFHQIQREMQAAAGQILPRVLHVEERRGALHVAAAISLEEALGQLLADYALRQPTVRVRAIYGASNELAEHILAGAPCDLFLSADATQVERLGPAGVCAPSAPRVFARNGLAIVAPANASIRLRRPQDLAQSTLGRLAVADPESPLGRYTRDYLTQLGISEQMHERLVVADSSRGVLSVMESRGAEIGLVYSSDAMTSAGVQILLRPRSEASVAEYWAVVPARSPGSERAIGLIEYLASANAGRRLRAFGFQPVGSKRHVGRIQSRSSRRPN
jgi:molybdenum ABC transporter molybdate-binding protein